ncbi:hypothetical protein [Streptomyces griseorubiginosus]|uniref:hypothetical protein n=1 Tax=Streptomyces griseorubiginosus TaxID=67304 RepID=UPI0036E96D8B
MTRSSSQADRWDRTTATAVVLLFELTQQAAGFNVVPDPSGAWLPAYDSTDFADFTTADAAHSPEPGHRSPRPG